jgi:hypothetical protein
MSENGFSVGRDLTLTVVTSSGALGLSLITGWRSKQDIIDQKIKGLDGRTRHVRFPDGWSGSFNLERQNSTLDTYFAQLEANYYLGIGERPASITEIIAEPDGSISKWRYTGVLLKYDDAGDWAGDKTVKQALSFLSERRLRLA